MHSTSALNEMGLSARLKGIFVSIMAVIVSAVVLLFGLGSTASAQIKEIRIADSKGDWGYPNPYRHYPRGPGYVRMSWVFDTLVWKGKNGYVPALAREWSYDPEKTAFAFKLDPKAKWHDGVPITADDVVFTLNYYKKHTYIWISVEYVDRAEAVDPRTVIIYLSKPYAPFISDIGGTMPVLPRHIWESVEDPKAFDDPRSFVGSGPYLFKDFNKAQGSYLFEAFNDYYQGRPKADRLIYVRSGKALASLSTGQVDLANIQPEMAEPLEKKGLTVIRDERGWNKKLMINHKKAPFDRREFRQALAHAINQQEIVDKSHRGFATPASYGLLTIDHAMYNPDTPTYSFNPAKARELIESLGFSRGAEGFYQKDGQPLSLELLSSNVTVAGESVPDRDGEIIKKQLEEVGIHTELVNMEQATTDSRVKNWDFDLAVSGHGGIGGDPRILNETISSTWGQGSVNCARYDDHEELNRLLEAQMFEMDEAKRKDIVFKIQEVYARELPAISLYYPDALAAFNPEKGVVWYYTPGGISKGIPIPQNKMSLVTE
jgi:peptide/nickel transport system substrate-binding protein